MTPLPCPRCDQVECTCGPGTLDFEVTGSGPWTWHAYDRRGLFDNGSSRNRLGLNRAVRRCRRRWERIYG